MGRSEQFTRQTREENATSFSMSTRTHERFHESAGVVLVASSHLSQHPLVIVCSILLHAYNHAQAPNQHSVSQVRAPCSRKVDTVGPVDTPPYLQDVPDHNWV